MYENAGGPRPPATRCRRPCSCLINSIIKAKPQIDQATHNLSTKGGLSLWWWMGLATLCVQGSE